MKESSLKVGGLFLPTIFLLLLLYFWNYNPSPNGQIVSLIGAQAHPQIQLLRAEWYKVLMILNCRTSPTKKLEEKSNFNPIYYIKVLGFFAYIILRFLVFFAGNQYMKTPIKVSVKVQRIMETIFRISI